MNDPTWTSLLPPLLAIALAVWTKQVYLSLAAGLWLACTILAGWNPLAGLADTIDGTVGVLADAGNARAIMFTLVMGALIATLEASGGVRGFVRYLETRRWVNNGKRSQFLAAITGMVIFIESNITVLVAGSVARPLFDRYRSSREKLAYIIDSTSAPVCILVPANAWFAFNLSILDGLEVEDPMGVFLGSIPVNFYAIVAILLVFLAIWRGIDIGPMKRAEERAATGKKLWPGSTPMVDEGILSPVTDNEVKPRAVNMLLPIVVMVVFMPIGLFITGGGQMSDGEGSLSVLWASLVGLGTAWTLLILQKAYGVHDLVKIALKGAGALIPLALILLLALALGSVVRELGTGAYVAGVTAGTMPTFIYLPLVFVVASVIAFSTGTSWGTFGIMLPIAVPAAMALDLPLAPFVAASLSGGIFGDHCSPISDTTIISSMASATDHIDHVRTQLPYALVGGGLAAVMFGVLGATL